MLDEDSSTSGRHGQGELLLALGSGDPLQGYNGITVVYQVMTILADDGKMGQSLNGVPWLRAQPADLPRRNGDSLSMSRSVLGIRNAIEVLDTCYLVLLRT